MNALGRRVDMLVMAYRVRLHGPLIERLKESHRLAGKWGESSVWWRGKCFGSVRFSRKARSTYHVKNDKHGYQLHIDLFGPDARRRTLDDGAVEEEPGWTVELVVSAQRLATEPLASVLRSGRELAEFMGDVFDERVRRLDLCCDVAGLVVSDITNETILRRPRCRPAHDVLLRDESDAVRAHFAETMHTGWTVGSRAGQVLCRIYDKPEELRYRGDKDKEEKERARWKRDGWDGESPVGRVEFQLRATAMHELGLRDPSWAVDRRTGEVLEGGLPEHLDRVWQTCLEWCRVVERRKTEDGRLWRKSECPDAPLWQVLRDVLFCAPPKPEPAFRRRMRGSCKSGQWLGVSCSILGRRQKLPAAALSEDIRTYKLLSEAEATALLREQARAMGVAVADELVEDMLEDFGSREALVGMAVRTNAARARFQGPDEVTVRLVTADGEVVLRYETEVGDGRRTEQGDASRQSRGRPRAQGDPFGAVAAQAAVGDNGALPRQEQRVGGADGLALRDGVG